LPSLYQVPPLLNHESIHLRQWMDLPRLSASTTRGMFYGSRSRSGSLEEGAYYALLFWEGLIDPPPVPIRRRQTLFSVLLETARGLQLQTISELAAQAILLDPSNYGPTQLF